MVCSHMNNEKLVSIIVPVYKVEECLPTCIHSLMTQTYKNVEIICVDDGSPDNCPALLDQYAEKDKRIKVIHKENGGVASARNRGVAEATGEFISFVDSDDWIDERYVEILMQGIEQYGGDVSACGCTRVSTIGERREKNTERAFFIRASQEELLNHWALRRTVWGKIYKRRLLADRFFISQISLAEDAVFNLNVICHTENIKIYETDLPLYYWYMRENSITHTVKTTDYLGVPRWYVDHMDEVEKTGYEWVLRLVAFKLALSGRFFAEFEEKDYPIKKEANRLLWRMMPGLLKSRYAPRRLKILHLAMAGMPGVYHLGRLANDPTMLPKEKERIKKTLSIRRRVGK